MTLEEYKKKLEIFTDKIPYREDFPDDIELVIEINDDNRADVIDKLSYLGWDFCKDYSFDKSIFFFITDEEELEFIDDGEFEDYEKLYELHIRTPYLYVPFVTKINNNLYCSCASPNLVQNQVLGKSFQYCRQCKKEKV